MDCQIPMIVVTPALPSRKSLPADMRATLDAIIGPAPPAKAFEWMSEPSDAAPDSDLEDEDVEEPHVPSRTHRAVAETAPRLELHLENARFSVGAVVSALEEAFRGVPAHDAASCSVVTDGTSEASSSRTPHGRSCPRAESRASYSSSTDSLLLTSEIESLPEDIWEDASDEDVPSARAIRRAPPYGWTGNPTWRHAMYVSPLVWPLEVEEGSDGASRRQADTSARSESLKHGFQWSSFRTLAQGALALGRTRVRHG
ncbi:hypothetical protein VTO73DRAFT_2131 [Trametes versicolor]